jgi:hypothetical protein
MFRKGNYDCGLCNITPCYLVDRYQAVVTVFWADDGPMTDSSV